MSHVGAETGPSSPDVPPCTPRARPSLGPWLVELGDFAAFTNRFDCTFLPEGPCNAECVAPLTGSRRCFFFAYEAQSGLFNQGGEGLGDRPRPPPSPFSPGRSPSTPRPVAPARPLRKHASTRLCLGSHAASSSGPLHTPTPTFSLTEFLPVPPENASSFPRLSETFRAGRKSFALALLVLFELFLLFLFLSSLPVSPDGV